MREAQRGAVRPSSPAPLPGLALSGHVATYRSSGRKEAAVLASSQPNLPLSCLAQVPVPLADRRRRFLAMKWMITECREKKPRRMLMPEKLSQEMLEAFYNRGPVIKRKHDMHKMAEANRSLAHYRWW